MSIHKIADILFNLSLDMDYADSLDESENYHNTIEHQIIDKLELDNLMDEFDRDNQRKIFELLIVGYSQKDIRKLLEINLYRWKKLMTDMKELVGKYLDECYND